MKTSRALSVMVAAAAGCLALTSATGAGDAPQREQQPVAVRDIAQQAVVYRRSNGVQEGGLAGTCPQALSTHTNANFGGGSYIMQAGMVESEVAACSYTLAPGAFPIRLDLTEMIFATNAATVQSTTKWTIMVWSGTPANGTLVFSASSDGDMLPHLVMPPGTSGTNVQFMIDPSDPEQIYITDDGSHTFSIGYRIDDHHAQTNNGCWPFTPSSSMNAFPTTDTSGLAAPTQNWVYMFDCGAFGCGAGWKSFAQIPTSCRPTGDWVMRATWTSLGNCQGAPTGACCSGDGCAEATAADCQSIAGTYRGDGVSCASVKCVSDEPGPCCFAATGGCITLEAADCTLAGGVPGPAGVTCAAYTCFPTGACCMPDGTCVGPVSPAACASAGGTYKGNNSSCAVVTCPPPVGAACFSTGFCLQLSEADALAAGAVWGGAGTACVDANSNGTPDACEAAAVPGDLNGDGLVNGADLGILLSTWGGPGAADFDGNGTINGSDLGFLLAHWASN